MKRNLHKHKQLSNGEYCALVNYLTDTDVHKVAAIELFESEIDAKEGKRISEQFLFDSKSYAMSIYHRMN